MTALVRRVHLKDMEVRRGEEAVFVTEKERIDVVHHLRTRCHAHLLRIAIECIEREGSGKSIADGDLLTKDVGGVQLCAFAIPGAVFVDNQLDLVLGIVLTHNCPLVGNDPFHPITLAEQLEPIHQFEL